MEITAEKTLDSKLALYRTCWFLFMVLVFGPAWYLASSVEGVSFGLAVGVVKSGLMELYFPGWLAGLLSYPVTVFATIIPGSSKVAFGFLYVCFGAFVPIAFATIFIYFALVQPPYYQYMQAADPEWSPKPGSRSISFTGMIVAILITALAGELLYGFVRNPIADNYSGKVYLVDSKDKTTPLDVELKLDIIEPGLVYDKKPGVPLPSLHIKFEGKDTAMLKKLGIDDQLFDGNVDAKGYGSVVCYAGRGTQRSDVAGYSWGHMLYISNHYKNGVDEHCPKSMNFGMESFDDAQFSIDDISKNYMIVVDLKRDSRFGFIQRKIMEYRYSQDPYRYFRQKN